MKNRILLLVAILFAVNINAQDKGLTFETGTFEQALVKAKKNKKLLFVDCYTQWCGPCQMMLKEVFPQELAGKFFNSKFVNFKIDMNVSEGVELNKRFHVTGYPTFLILNADGKEVARMVGGNRTIESFIERVEHAINPENSLDTLQRRYLATKSVQTGLPYLKALQVALLPIDSLVSELYFSAGVAERFNAELLEIAFKTIKTLDNPLFVDICIHKKDGDVLLGEHFLTEKIKTIYTDVLQKYIARNRTIHLDDQLILNAAIHIGLLAIPSNDPVAHLGKIALLVSKKDFDAVADYPINNLVDVIPCRNKFVLEGAISVCLMNETTERKIKLVKYYEKMKEKSTTDNERYKRMLANSLVKK